MANRKLRGVLVDTKTCRTKAVTLNDSLESFYEALHCTTIDIVSRIIAGKRVDIVCDDEALLKDRPRISAITPGYEATLFGSLFVVGPADEEGNLTSLSKSEIKEIMSTVRETHTMSDSSHGDGRPVRMLTRVCTIPT